MEEANIKKAPRLLLNSCEDLLCKLKWEYKQLEKDWSNIYVAFNFAITANHLYVEWINKVGSRSQRRRQNTLPELASKVLKVWREIANASKHYELDEKNKKTQVTNEVLEPMICDWHAYFISGPVIYISIGEVRVSISMLADVTIRVLEWIIETEEDCFEFPDEIQQSLVYMFNSD